MGSTSSMRLLLVSDLHYSLPLFDWVVDVADDFDVIVMAGDHLELASLVDRRAQAAVVKKYFARIRSKTRLLVCSGNHDLDSTNAAGEQIARWLLGARNHGLLSDGESLAIDGALFTMCPWWDGPVSRAEIGEQLAKAAEDRKDRWIWIYHAPPSQSPVAWAGQRYFGDDALRSWIEEYQPDIVMTGHVHEAPYVADGSWVDKIGKTWIFNTGHYPGAPPAHVIMDTDAGEAVWFSAAGNQYIRFEDELTRPVTKLQSLPDWLKAENLLPAQRPS
jgi:Icc-related predicted phosphoesterase